MFAGIAKDLTKLGGKTVTKLVTPEGKNTRLFRLVSLLTGWKNSLKVRKHTPIRFFELQTKRARLRIRRVLGISWARPCSRLATNSRSGS